MNGTIYDVYFSALYVKSFQGQKVVTQLFAADVGQVGGIVLSDASQANMPLPPTGLGHESAYV